MIEPIVREVAWGNYVRWEDYARLKAEVERWKFTLEEERQIMREDWAGLRCEKDRVQRALEYAEAQVERLTKAGDALAGEAIRLEYSNYWSEYEKVEDVCIDEVEAWHKAKEVQS